MNENDNQHETTSSTNNEEQWTATKLLSASYKDLGSPAAVEDRFMKHLLEHCTDDLIELLQSCSTTTRDYSMKIDTFNLMKHDTILGFLLLRYPQTLLPILQGAIIRAQQELIRQHSRNNADDADVDDVDVGVQNWNVKGGSNNGSTTAMTRVHARLVHLPPFCCKSSLGRSLTANDVGKIMQVTGTVVRAGPVQMYESARTYKCSGVKSSNNSYGGGGWGRKKSNSNGNSNNKNNNKQPVCVCGRTFVVHADLEQRNNALQEPETCPGALMQSSSSNNGERCPGNKFQIVDGGSVHTDYQEIKIQDTASSQQGVGHIPRSLLIKLQHDLVDTCQPGDEVVVVGILLAQWQQPKIADGIQCQVGLAMAAHSIRVIAEKGSSVWKHDTTKNTNNNNNSNSVGEMEKFKKEFALFWSQPKNIQYPIAARDFICKAVCPKLYGMQIIKLALLITLIGGVSSDVYEVDNDDDENDHDNNEQSDTLQLLHGTTQNDGIVGSDSDDCRPQVFRLDHRDESNKNNNNALAYYGDTNRVDRRQKKRNAKVKTRRRDQSHILLVGDPGTGKSQILRFAAALCPRSVLTTGVGTTSAGLTCAAVREGSGKEFALEAGALVLADKGVCCIDEFGCIRESDRTTIHEAMEQQTLSVAKAGIVCKLNCRATIIAVMNPRDCLYDIHASLSVNTGLGTPLLSRFDIIFKLVDSSDAERDSNVTTYLLNRAIQGAGFDVTEFGDTDSSDNNNDIPWNMDKLRAYISVVKETFQPSMSDEAALLLERHYEKCRSSQSSTIPVTVRFLESLIRLSQAHARLMHRTGNTVILQDAVAVIQIMECTAFAYGGFDGVGIVDDIQNVLYRDPMSIDFSNEPDLDFICFEYRILERYGMLEYMDHERRKIALNEFGTNNENDTGDGSGWNEVENQQYNVLGNPGTTQDSSLFTSTTQQWSAPTDNGHYENWSQQQQQQNNNNNSTDELDNNNPSSVSQDHYGRVYFGGNQNQNNNNNKRPRY